LFSFQVSACKLFGYRFRGVNYGEGGLHRPPFSFLPDLGSPCIFRLTNYLQAETWKLKSERPVGAPAVGEWGMEGNNNPKGARPILPPRRARERQTGTKEIALTPVDQTTSDYASEFPSNRFCRR